MNSKRNPIWLPILLWAIVTFAYALRRYITSAGFPIDPYFLTLFTLPILLVILGRISFSELGLQVGKPFTGLFFVFLLPTILFIRFYLLKIPFQISDNFFPNILIGSIAEEFFFRGYLQEELNKRFNATLSISFASLLFALVHVVKGYSLINAGSIFLIGLYFGITRDKQGGDSTFYSMGAHSLYNLIVTSMQRIAGRILQ